MRLPSPRGPVSESLTQALLTRNRDHTPHELPDRLCTALSGNDPLLDEDLQLTLFVCYELHYRGWAGVDDRWEWSPSLLRLRAAAEALFERRLRALVAPVPVVPADEVPADEVPAALAELAAADDGPPLSAYLGRHATPEQFREFVAHRSVYHLREADPHTWAIPRLDGPAKAALIEIQIDEYGAGQLPRMHAQLFRTTMDSLGLDSRYGAYVDAVPALTLATNNLMSLFGLHRRHRGAVLGHLAAFEMTSSLPNRRYGNGLRRLGGTPAATRFYDEHVEADAVHEQIAAHDLCGRFCAEEPAAVADVLFGAACALAVERLFAARLLGCWQGGISSLRTPLDARPSLAAVTLPPGRRAETDHLVRAVAERADR
jgi:hypothetical protein